MSEAAEAVERARHLLGSNLQLLALFGSYLSPQLRRPDSVPDLFALVDDLQKALRELHAPRGARLLARVLAPTTLALQDDAGVTIAKLNLAEPVTVAKEVGAAQDLYLAGRISKHSQLLFSREPHAEAVWSGLQAQAAALMVRWALLGQPRVCRQDEVVLQCVTLSYRAEARPESPERRAAIFHLFPSQAMERFLRLIRSQATAKGMHPCCEFLIDRRPWRVRAGELLRLEWFLLWSRARSVARWPKQALSYRGWRSYLRGKLARAWAPASGTTRPKGQRSL